MTMKAQEYARRMSEIINSDMSLDRAAAPMQAVLNEREPREFTTLKRARKIVDFWRKHDEAFRHAPVIHISIKREQ